MLVTLADAILSSLLFFRFLLKICSMSSTDNSSFLIKVENVKNSYKDGNHSESMISRKVCLTDITCVVIGALPFR